MNMGRKEKAALGASDTSGKQHFDVPSLPVTDQRTCPAPVLGAFTFYKIDAGGTVSGPLPQHAYLAGNISWTMFEPSVPRIFSSR